MEKSAVVISVVVLQLRKSVLGSLKINQKLIDFFDFKILDFFLWKIVHLN